MQPNTCRNIAFSSASTRFHPYFGWSYHLYTYLYHPKQGINLIDLLENALFVHAFAYMFELTVTGSCIIATQLFPSGLSYLTFFLIFHCDPYFLSQIGFLNQALTGHRLACAWFLKIVCVWTSVCVFVCVHPEAINIYLL